MAKKKKTTTTKTTEPKQVKITAAKGRPMLTWVGKRPLAHVTAFPAQRVERHDALTILGIPRTTSDKMEDEDNGYERRIQTLRDLGSGWNRECWKDQPSLGSAVPEWGGLLFHGDNKDVLAYLLANGFRRSVNLIYIDPPFDSGADYVRKVSLRGPKGTAKLDGEGYALGEQIQYTDIWTNDNYLQFMYERLLLLKELLANNGVIWLHCDRNRSHYLHALLDEVFGESGFVNEIVWQRISAHPDSTYFGHVHDTLFFYAVNPGNVPFRTKYVPYPAEFVKQYFTKDDGDGRGFYWTGDLTAPGPRPGLDYEFRGRRPSPGRVWFTLKEKLESLDDDRRIYWPAKGGIPKLKRYLNEYPGIPATSIWSDIKSLAGSGAPSSERLDYPTQKPESLLERIIECCSRPGDLVLDCFLGSGTTATVAQKLGRRWIGCDINKGAIQTTAKRLRGIVDEQIQEAIKAAEQRRQGKLPGIAEDEAESLPKPAQFGFTVWRVNDYDLQIQHNEAVNLACEHIGVERTRTDNYFDGVRGKSLVKIVPFSHPLSPLDLDELKRELDARPDEDRSVTVVCLGIELAAKAWVDDWNQLRKGRGAVNKIDVIELRTDAKYGKFIKHKPARAKVKISHAKGKITVEIQDFISPTILERLEQQAGLLKPKIDDWRAMVDCVMIDTAYDGSVFNVVLADVPEKKSDLVLGRYEVPAPVERTVVAVKIVDMLGEEVLVVQN